MKKTESKMNCATNLNASIVVVDVDSANHLLSFQVSNPAKKLSVNNEKAIPFSIRENLETHRNLRKLINIKDFPRVHTANV